MKVNHEATAQSCQSVQRPPVQRAWMLALLLSALCAVAGATTPPRPGEDDLERENLARMAHEIGRLQEMVRSAQASAPTGQRVRFRYEWLLRDLELMHQGIAEHTDAPRQPRAVAPLRGDYRQ